jgi:hypothetical protein
MEHLADLLPLDKKNDLANWVMKYGNQKAYIYSQYSMRKLTFEQFDRYTNMNHQAFINKFYKD